MKPKRPDSAKTQFTKLTQDSDSLKKDLNASKFSQTFSSGVNSNSQRTDDFRQYVAEKDRDPRFKHLKHKLQVIEEKTSQPAASKTNFKPFEKKKEKTVEKNSGRKVQEVVEKVQKADEQLNLSRGFAQKNKEKMNSLKMAPIQKQQQQKIKQTLKPKLKFDAFKINKPGQKRQSKKAQQVEVKKESPKKIEKPAAQPLTQQQKKKLEQKLKKQYQESQLRDIQRFVNDIQARNINYFPNNYDRVVNSTVTNNAQDLQKIDLRNFLDEPTQQDYEQLKAKIRNMDDELETSKMEQSIDLQSLIGDKSQTQDFTNEQQKSLYASMSSSQIKKRNAFITQIISGKISKKQIEQIEKMQKTSLKMYKIEREKDEQEVQFSQINLVKRQSNRLMERNRIQASGQLYRDCDYLSQEHQQRLQALLNGELEESPFECDDLERMKRRRIDQGIRMYRQLSGCQQQKLQAASEDHLPKDPELRKQAEKKVLRQKITNVNKRLSEVDKIDVSKAKIQALIKKFEHTRASSNLSSTLIQQQQKFKEQIRRLQELEGMIQNFTNKENTEDIFKEIEASYKQLQAQIQRYAQMDEQQMKKQQKKRLQQKLRQLQAIQKESNDLESQINQIQKIKCQVQSSLASFDRMQAVQLPDISCENFNEGQTLEDIDAIIQRKLKLYGNHPLQQDNQ